MAKVDLHVHSAYSDHPSEWFLQRLGAKESYTDPETVFLEARKKGMDFVTITDHNDIRGSLILKEKYPDQVITGVETTAYFPENGCKIHLLVFGLNQAQFNIIDKHRTDIYRLRDYLQQEDLAHSVAHATYSINKKLDITCIEKLFLLFDCFEVINGSRGRTANEILMDALQSLTPDIIDRLSLKHNIKPFSDSAWIKGFTAGTDDHSGLFIGSTYTYSNSDSPEMFLEQLKSKQTSACGQHNDYQGLAFSLYKIACDFSKHKGKHIASSFISAVSELIFDKKPMGFKDRLSLRKIRMLNRVKSDVLQGLIVDLIDSFHTEKEFPVEEKIDIVYDNISRIADHLLKELISGIETDMNGGNFIGVFKRISAALPALFLSAPFFTTMEVLNQSRLLLNALTESYCSRKRLKKRRVLWFADNSIDLPNMQEIVSEVINRKEENRLEIFAAGCTQPAISAPLNHLRLESIYTLRFTAERSLVLQTPSLLSSLKKICEFDPDEIFISTPGPVGILGIIAARLLHVNCTAVWDTGLHKEIMETIGDEDMGGFVQIAINWLYSNADNIAVPETPGTDMFYNKGYNPEKLKFIRTPIAHTPVTGTDANSITASAVG